MMQVELETIMELPASSHNKLSAQRPESGMENNEPLNTTTLVARYLETNCYQEQSGSTYWKTLVVVIPRFE